MMNRLANTKNRYQGDAKRVLCVCSAGMLRSPTAAQVLANPPFSFNTRSCGVSHEYALIVIDPVLVEWADEIVCMEPAHATRLRELPYTKGKRVVILDIPDIYRRMDDKLIELIKEKYNTTEAIIL